jgi:putative ABC transport system substrate-binding protein
MRRRDFTIGLLLAVTTQSVQAEGRPKQHRIAIVISAGPVSRIDDPGSHLWHPFWEELRRLGDIEGQNLTVERYAGEGRPEGYADLFREIVNRNPDVIVGHDQIVAAAPRTTSIIPIVVIGAPIVSGLTTSLARPGGNLTGVDLYAGIEIWGKRLQILTEAIPSASKVAFLAMRGYWEGVVGQELRQAGQRLKISMIAMPLQAATPSEYRRVFTEIEQDRPDAIVGKRLR